MKRLFLLAALAAAPAVAARKPPPCPPKAAQLFLAPMGQPFRAGADAPDPMAAWIAQADADRDGTVSRGEFLADADAFFARLDLDRDGELIPSEISPYEMGVPETRLYAPRGAGAPAPRQKRKKDERYDVPAAGAGRYAFLNIPQPVASADADFNRGVTRAEFAAAAADRFARIDAGQAGGATGRLDPAKLPKTPAQKAATGCDPTRPPPAPKAPR
ncbi:MAG: hypothetical protein ABW173_09810 [Sphingomonas sp.]